MKNIVTKQEIFSYVKRFNGISSKTLIHVSDISYYNHNYYKTDNDNYLLYAESDDDDYTSWYLCNNNSSKIVCFGESFSSSGNIIEVFDDIKHMDFYDCE